MGVSVDDSLPYDGNRTLGGVGFAGPWDAAQHSYLYRYGGAHLNNIDARGPVRNTLNELQIAAVPGAQQVTINTGSAWVRGVLGLVTAQKTLAVPPNNTGGNRLDMVVMRHNGSTAANSMELVVRIGTAAAYPVPQFDANDDGIHEIPLWRWISPNAFVDLTAVTFDDMRAWSNVPYIVAPVLTNNSGAEVLAGTPVIYSAGAANSFDTSAVYGDQDIIGVTVGGISAAGGAGRVAVAGIVEVNVTGAVAIGDWLRQSTTVGRAETGTGGFAQALSANAGGLGTVWAFLGWGGFNGCEATGAGPTAVGAGVWTSMPLNAENFDTDAMHDNAVNNSRIYARIAGRYRIHGQLNTSAAAGASHAARLYLNNMTSLSVLSGFSTVAQYETFTLSTTSTLAVGDYVEVQGLLSGGGNLYQGQLRLELIRGR